MMCSSTRLEPSDLITNGVRPCIQNMHELSVHFVTLAVGFSMFAPRRARVFTVNTARAVGKK